MVNAPVTFKFPFIDVDPVTVKLLIIVVGLFISMMLLALGLFSIRVLRIASNHLGETSPCLLFSHSVMASYSIELLVRGTGYFTGSAILLVCSLRIFLSFRKSYFAPRPVDI